MLLGGNTQLVVERVVPDLLHVVPVGDDAVLDGVLERQDTSLALCLVADVAVFLTHTHHHALPPKSKAIRKRIGFKKTKTWTIWPETTCHLRQHMMVLNSFQAAVASAVWNSLPNVLFNY